MTVLSDFPSVGDHFLGRYRIESVLGTGGFARVYRATQTDLDREVAIKVMRPGIDAVDSTEETIAQIEQIEQRFRREAKVISKFRSPNTVVVHDYGRTDGGLMYMTLEYVDGETLAAVIKRDSPLPPARAVRLIRQVLESLHEAHAFDVLHRDIKPQNLMVFSHLDRDDLIKVLDFGIAKVIEVDEEAAAVEELTTVGTLIGTPRYMSPEQIRGDRLSPASDIYSLGLVLYEAVTGVKAVGETTTMRIIAVHLDPRPLGFPPESPLGDGLRTILRGMIEKEPVDRFQSARDVLRALDGWDMNEPLKLATTPEAAKPPELPPIPRARLATPTIGATLAPMPGPATQPPDAEELPPETVVVDINPFADTGPTIDAPESDTLTGEDDTEANEAFAPPVAPTPEPIEPFDVAPTTVGYEAPDTEDETMDAPFPLVQSVPLLPILGVAGVVLMVGLVFLLTMSTDSTSATDAVGGDNSTGVAHIEEPPAAPASEEIELEVIDDEPATNGNVVVATGPPDETEQKPAEAPEPLPDVEVKEPPPEQTQPKRTLPKKRPPKKTRGFFSVERTK